ncbi:MAG TPA: ABC transporter permease [Rectinemataceae bacterium]|nr:ABC transporter permease [Rectinemataceae bacterium]
MIRRGLRTRLPAVFVALCFAVLEALISSRDPLGALSAFFLAPLSDPWRTASLLGAMAPLLVAGLGAAVSFRAGIFNLGGEGQAALGFFVGSLFLTRLASLPPALALVLAFSLSALAGAAIASVSALAERKLGASVLLTTFILSQALVIAVDWAVAGPFRDPASNLLGMAPLPAAYLLPRPFGALPLGMGPFLALGIALAMIWLLRASRPGFELELFGRSRDFARAQGLDPLLYFWPLALSGALSGMAGLLATVGASGQAVQGMTAGLGWNGLAVSLVAGTDPLLSIPSALFFAWLSEGAKAASILSDLPTATASVITALIVLLVTARTYGPGSKKLRETITALRKGAES